MKISWTNKESVLAAVNSWPEIFVQEFQRGLNLVGDVVVGEIVPLAPTGTGDGPWGHLSNSIAAGEPVAGAGGWTIMIGTPADHAEVVEHGRKPGSMPPVDAIASWVWGKRYIFTDVKDEKDAMRVAWAIARSIQQKGFSSAPHDGGWKMFERGVKNAMPAVERIMVGMKSRIEQRCEAEANG